MVRRRWSVDPVTSLAVVSAMGGHFGALAETTAKDWTMLGSGFRGPPRESCTSHHHGKFACFPLVDNFRDTTFPLNEQRPLYRTTSATSACTDCDGDALSASCKRNKAVTVTKRQLEYSTKLHWVYADQSSWNKYAGSTEINECLLPSSEMDKKKRPGESPNNIKPNEASDSLNSYMEIRLDGFDDKRTGLTVSNNGHVIEVIVCGSNGHDCGALASFGQWPRKLRGLAETLDADSYYLSRIEFHWGSDDSKGSEHKMCGKPRSAEMHMVFANKNKCYDPDTKHHLCSPKSEFRGTEYVILAVLIETKNGHSSRRKLGSSTSTSSALGHIFKDAAGHAKNSGESHASVDVTLSDLLPEGKLDRISTLPA